ncbi:LPXTG cell wall anchor domain-containing protein, partial [Granulicatella balaenopterae]
KYAPKGFEVVTDITFKVDENGKVIVENNQATVNKEGVLVVVDDYSKLEKPVTLTKVEKSVTTNLPKTGSKSMLVTSMLACISGLFGIIIIKNKK